MKAIVSKVLHATDYKPTRIKVQAEGVPHIVVPRGDGTEEENHRNAALLLCKKYSWGSSLVSGGLPTPGQWVHCFVKDEVKPNKLAEALQVIVDNCGEDDECLDLNELCTLRWSVKDCAKSALGLV